MNAAPFSVIRIAGGAYSSRSRTSSSKSPSGDTSQPMSVCVASSWRTNCQPASVPLRDHAALVVIDAEEVDRGRDALHVALPDRRPVRAELLLHVRRVCAPEDRVEEPAVPVPVECPRGRDVFGGFGRGLRGLEVDRDADERGGRLSSEGLGGEAVGEQNVMGGGDRVGRGRPPGRMDAVAVAEPGDHPGLVERDPATDAVAEARADDLRVLAERLGGAALGPAAGILERGRQIPVVQRDKGLDPVGEQLVDDAVVEVEPGRRSPARDPPAGCAATRSRAEAR